MIDKILCCVMAVAAAIAIKNATGNPHMGMFVLSLMAFALILRVGNLK